MSVSPLVFVIVVPFAFVLSMCVLEWALPRRLVRRANLWLFGMEFREEPDDTLDVWKRISAASTQGRKSR